MSVVIGRPIKLTCIYNAVGNPIVYTLSRQDLQFVSITNSGGFAQFNITGAHGLFSVLDIMWISAFNTKATVTAVSFAGGNTHLTTDLAYTIDTTGFVNNLSKRNDYRIDVEVFDYLTNESLGPAISANPDISGSAKFNISGIVSAHLFPDWNFVEDGTNVEFEDGTSNKVYIKYTDYYDGAYQSPSSDSANPIICVFAMINLLLGSPPDFRRYPYGGNMHMFVLDQKWMTRFQAMSMWRNWPFTMSLPSNTYAFLHAVVFQYNSAGEVIIADTRELAFADEGIYRMTLGSLTDAFSSETRELGVKVTAVDGVNIIIEEIRVALKDPCKSPVLLFWKNSLGGDSWWMFDESQEYKYTYPSGRRVTRLKLNADNLVLSEWDAINELNSTTDIIAANLTDYGMDDSINKTHFRDDNQVYIVNQDGSKVGVIVVETENVTNTKQVKHAIEITIELPELFTV